MKIAVPLFGNRISPHFGASSEILLIETQNGKIIQKTVIDVGANGAGQIARHLTACGVNRIVCGGIQRTQKRWLTDNGIQVVDNQKGPAEELLVSMITSGFVDENER